MTPSAILFFFQEVKFLDAPPKRLEYTADPLMSSLASDKAANVSNSLLGEYEKSVSPKTPVEALSNGTNSAGATAEAGDLIGALLERGDRLRKAMAVFAIEENEWGDRDVAAKTDSPVDRYAL